MTMFPKKLAATLAGGLGLLSLTWSAPGHALELQEVPSLADKVADGSLPAVINRLPTVPQIVPLDGDGLAIGKHGGEMQLLMGRHKDIRLMTVYGYARLVGYDRELNLVPDILESIEVEESRVFTMTLRENHRWSDGHPFTAEDFRFYWEDYVLNPDVFPFKPPKVLLVDGVPPTVEFLDARTIRYSWPSPNPLFLTELAGARPLYLYRPAHYLKQFHGDYADPTELQAKVEESGKRKWEALLIHKSRQYRFDNVELPSLQPWVNTTPPPADRFTFQRNPFYHRMDSAGQQLPYIDRVIINIADKSLIPAKTGYGDSDLQGRNIRFEDYTFLKEGEKDNDFEVRRWRTASGSQIALFPNLTVNDPVWRDLMRDVRFRRALSLAIDRRKINQVVYYGLAREGADTVLPDSPLYDEAYRTAWSSFDTEQANALLDEIGLTEWDGDLRLLPDGRPLEIIIDTAGESTEETDVLELIKQDWAQVGISLFTKPSQREVFRNRVFAGSALMTVWNGLENGVPTADMSPRELAPTAQTQLQWAKWGQFFETNGSAGEPPDMPMAEELAKLNEDWRLAKERAEREEIWHKMLQIHADQVFTIGILNGIWHPVVVSNHLQNVPVEGLYNWNPGAFFGIYKPDSFWFADGHR